MSIKLQMSFASTGVAVIALAGGLAAAAPVSFGSATYISGPTDVSTAGTLVSATTFDQQNPSTSETVNGVTFTLCTQNTSDSNWYYCTGIDVSVAESFGSGGYTSTMASDGFTSYAEMLDRASANAKETGGVFTPAPIVLSNLTPGSNYQMELWSGIDGNGQNPTYLTSGSSSVTLVNGSFVIASFTADSTGTQSFAYYGDPAGNWASVDAIQLRDLSPVPEPGTLALFAFAGLALLAVGRKAGNCTRGNRAAG